VSRPLFKHIWLAGKQIDTTQAQKRIFFILSSASQRARKKILPLGFISSADISALENEF
jgi:hypothetical protein